MENKEKQIAAESLILKNIKLFEEASVLMEEEISSKIFNEFDTIVQNWMDENDFYGKADFHDNDEIFFAPNNWKTDSDKEDSSPAKFQFDEENGDSSHWWLSSLCHCSNDRAGFFFMIGKLQKAQWKPAFDSLSENSKTELRKLGFELKEKEKSFFLPFKLDNEKLALAFEQDDFDEAMEPIRQTLKSIEQAIPYFDEVINALR